MSKLFEEMQIGSMRARNRIVRAATAESLCTVEGAPSKRMVALYRELATGRVGTIITGYAYVCPDGKPSERSLNLGEDALCDELTGAFDFETRQKLTIDAEKIILADCVNVFMFAKNNFVMTNKKVSDVTIYPIDYYFLTNKVDING